MTASAARSAQALQAAEGALPGGTAAPILARRNPASTEPFSSRKSIAPTQGEEERAGANRCLQYSTRESCCSEAVSGDPCESRKLMWGLGSHGFSCRTMVKKALLSCLSAADLASRRKASILSALARAERSRSCLALAVSCATFRQASRTVTRTSVLEAVQGPSVQFLAAFLSSHILAIPAGTVGFGGEDRGKSSAAAWHMAWFRSSGLKSVGEGRRLPTFSRKPPPEGSSLTAAFKAGHPTRLQRGA